MFGKNTVYKAVMVAIKEKIRESEDIYQESMAALEDTAANEIEIIEEKCEADILAVNDKLSADRSAKLGELVTNIIGKIL